MPYDPRTPFDPSGIRLGTPAVTTRGMTASDMPRVAEWMDRAIAAAAKEDGDALDVIAAEVREFCAFFPIPGPPRE